jgi:hypothetical protein
MIENNRIKSSSRTMDFLNALTVNAVILATGATNTHARNSGYQRDCRRTRKRGGSEDRVGATPADRISARSSQKMEV